MLSSTAAWGSRNKSRERLILARATHLDSLVARLHEPRVRSVLEPLLGGQPMPPLDHQDDLACVRDLGLVAPTAPLRPADPIYREVLAADLDAGISADPPSFVQPDGRLDTPAWSARGRRGGQCPRAQLTRSAPELQVDAMPKRRPPLTLAWLGLSAMLLPLAATAGPPRPFVYDRLDPPEDSWRIESETAVGTREARPLGARGVEQSLRLQRGLGPVSVTAAGDLLLVDGEQRLGAAAEAAVDVLPADWATRLALGGGFARDTRGDDLVRGRAALGRRLGDFDLGTTGLAEVPLTGERDVVDLIVGVEASWRASADVALALEVAGEDLEGFWEEDEAEGGARLLAGPGISWRMLGLDVAFNAALVVQATRSSVGRQAGGAGRSTSMDAPEPTLGFLGRLLLGRAF